MSSLRSWADTCQGCGVQGHTRLECPFADKIEMLVNEQQQRVRSRERRAISNPWKPKGRGPEEVMQQNNGTETNLLTTKQVAEALGLSTASVHIYLQAGRIKAAQRVSGGHYRFTPEEVERVKAWRQKHTPEGSTLVTRGKVRRPARKAAKIATRRRGPVALIPLAETALLKAAREFLAALHKQGYAGAKVTERGIEPFAEGA